MQYPLGWWGWFDQGQYLQSARALSHFDFAPQSHWYPLGYPFLGALFYRTVPNHAFFIPNLVCYLVILWMLYAICRKFLSRSEALILVAVGLLAQNHLMMNLLIPWSSIPGHALIYAAIYLMVFGKRQVADYALTALCAGLTFLCRPVTAIAFMPLFLVRALRGEHIYALAKRLSVATLIFALFVILMFALNHRIYGTYVSPYMQNERRLGFNISAVPHKLYSILLDGRTIYAEGRSVFSEFPWILVALPGALYAVKRYRAFAGVLVSICFIVLCYTAYNNFSSAHLFKYMALHYFLWIFPLLTLFAYLTVRHSWRAMPRAAVAAMVLIPTVLAVFLHVRLAPVAWEGCISSGDAGGAACINRGRDLVRPWSADWQGGKNAILSLGLNEERVFDGLYLEGWPQDQRAWPLLTLDGRKLTLFWDYMVIVRPPGVTVVLFNAGRARRIGVAVADDYRGRLSLSGLQLYRFGWRLSPDWRILASPFQRREGQQ